MSEDHKHSDEQYKIVSEGLVLFEHRISHIIEADSSDDLNERMALVMQFADDGTKSSLCALANIISRSEGPAITLIQKYIELKEDDDLSREALSFTAGVIAGRALEEAAVKYLVKTDGLSTI